MRPRRVVFLVIVLILTAGAGGAIVWRVQRARERARVEELRERLARRTGDPAEHHWLGLQLADREKEDEALGHLENAARAMPSDLRVGNDVRLWSVRFEAWDRCIAFFEELAASHPGMPEPRLQLALAYIDKMPDNMLGIVGQGKLSKMSIARLSEILKDEPPLSEDVAWSVHYALGMNHLYWPKALGHAPLSVESFQRCIDVQKTRIEGVHAYFLLPYLGLGDALVKEGRHEEARAAWREADMMVGKDPRLDERLAIEDDEALTRFVDAARGLGIVIDTDLTVLWGRAP